MRPALLALLLAGCPAALPENEHIAECCKPAEADAAADPDGCDWTTVRYTITRYAEPLASDERACRSHGWELYR